MSQPDPIVNGLDELRSRRERNRRTPPPPRHPRIVISEEKPAETTDPGPDEISHEISHEIVSDAIFQAIEVPVQPVTVVPRTPKVAPVRKAAAAKTYPRPSLDVDLTDPKAALAKPTMLSIPRNIVRRFERERPHAKSHMAVVLQALRAHADELPRLVQERRADPGSGDLFMYSAAAGVVSATYPTPLRIRPTVGELRVMDGLRGWVNEEIRRQEPGFRRASRSEVVAAALDVYLAKNHRRRDRD